MKKIMLVLVIAILFASCSSPMMPVDTPIVDTTDDRLVTGSPWVDTNPEAMGDYWIFENNGNVYLYVEGIGPAILHTWYTDNGLLTLDGNLVTTYSIDSNIFTWMGKTFN